jgi:acetyl esterase/lipase
VQPAAEQGEPYVVQHMVASGDREIKVCVCYPAGYWPLSAGAALLPWLVYLHAGGFVDGGVEAAKELARDLAESVPAVVVTPGYSLAPENPFPAAPEDAGQHGDVGTEAGEEAQGRQAALRAGRRRGRRQPGDCHGADAAGSRPAAAGGPVADPPRYGPVPVGDVFDASGADGNAAPLACNYRDYLPTPADSVHPYAAPALASRMSGLPATLVQVAEQDALRAEGEAFAKLAKAGIPARALIMPGACGDGVEQSHEKCQAWVEEGARFLRDCFAKADDAS